MEYERALFRVYERCLEGFRDNTESNEIGTKTCRTCEYLSFYSASLFLVSLIFLHLNFVGSPGCLPQLLKHVHLSRNGSGQFQLQKDQILEIDVANLAAFGFDGSGNDPLTANDGNFLNSLYKFKKMDSVPVALNMSDSFTRNKTVPININNATKPRDYEFAFDYSVLSLPEDIRKSHNFDIVNVTFAGTECLGSPLLQMLVPLGGVDTLVLNAVMFTFKKPGVLESGAGDLYSWSPTDVSPYTNVFEWLNFKLLVLVWSLFAFFFLSTSTALMVRVLISSGVVLLFPVFWLLQAFGMQPINMRIISLSYPWLGIPIELLQATRQSAVPFVIAHLARVIVLYFMYESTEIFMAMFFYDQREPGSKELWLYAIMMLWEYFSMIYVRCSLSIQIFPRASLALFLVYHFYLYSFPSGFHILALLVFFLYLTWLMVLTVSKFERPAFNRGDVSLEQPRAFYNVLPWPTWGAALAPDYTLFMPVSRRSVNIYDEEVQTRPQPAADGPRVEAPAPHTTDPEPETESSDPGNAGARVGGMSSMLLHHGYDPLSRVSRETGDEESPRVRDPRRDADVELSRIV